MGFTLFILCLGAGALGAIVYAATFLLKAPRPPGMPAPIRQPGAVTVAPPPRRSEDGLKRGEIIGAQPGSQVEAWRDALSRLGLEYPSDETDQVRAAIRLVQSVWGARHGADAAMPIAAQRFAVTVALGNPERISDLMDWDEDHRTHPRPPPPQNGTVRQDVETALAGIAPVRPERRRV